MPKWEGRTLLIASIVLIVLGMLIRLGSGFVDVLGFLMIVGGILTGAVGIIQMFSGDKGVSSDI